MALDPYWQGVTDALTPADPAPLAEADTIIARAMRDMFLLATIIGGHDLPKLNAMIYDAVVADLGQPGVGYDPAALWRAKEAAAREPKRLAREVQDRGGFAALQAEGWI